jgi:hypothetical protein
LLPTWYSAHAGNDDEREKVIMRTQLAQSMIAAIVLIAGAFGSPALPTRLANDQNAVMTIKLSPSTKILDLGPSDNPQPAHWNDVYYDDSGWEHPVPVDAHTLDCVQQEIPGWGSSPTYWGRYPNDYYLFRQTFMLPNAASYAGSFVDIGTPTGAGNSTDPTSHYVVYLNGAQIDTWQDRGLRRDPIGLNLQPGRNVLAIYAPSSNDSSGFVRQCSALTYTLHIQINGQSQPPSVPPASALTVTLPGQNAILTGPTLPFEWRAYPHAAYYNLQIWLVQSSGKQKIGVNSVTNYATRLSGTSYALSVRGMPKGVYHWRMAAADAQGTLISSWTSEATVTLP